MFQDIKSKRLIIFKGLLFLFLGLLGFATILLHVDDVRIALIVAVTIWAFCRFYYFAFYVIEKYVDPTYKFSSLFSCVAYLLRGRRKPGDR